MQFKASFSSIAFASLPLSASWFSHVSSAFQMPAGSLGSHYNTRTDTSSLDAKKILLCFDGSGNSPSNDVPDEGNDKSFTNVLKIHLLAGGSIDGSTESTFEPDQISLYEAGVATRTRLAPVNFFLGDIRFQTRPMLKQLEAIFKPGDEIYLIGFSRGAASARQFASDLYKDGIKTNNGRIREPPIEFLGCFDTVSMQVGRNGLQLLRRKVRRAIPKSSALGERDGKLADNIKLAVHNVALDDPRMWTNGDRLLGSFPPTLMGTDDKVDEVWFPGGHGDVGGNFFQDGLSDGSFTHICKNGYRVEEFGLETTSTKLNLTSHTDDLKEGFEIKPNDLDRIHVKSDERYRSPRPIYKAEGDKMKDGATVHIHKSVLDRLEGLQQTDEPYNVNEYLKDRQFAVVTSLGQVSEEKTNRLTNILEM